MQEPEGFLRQPTGFLRELKGFMWELKGFLRELKGFMWERLQPRFVGCAVRTIFNGARSAP